MQADNIWTWSCYGSCWRQSGTWCVCPWLIWHLLAHQNMYFNRHKGLRIIICFVFPVEWYALKDSSHTVRLQQTISIHRYTLRHVSRNTSCLAQKIILHVKIRYGFRTFQNVSKMRAMTQDTANQVIKVTMLEICHYEKSKKWFCRVYVDNYTKKDPFNEGFKIAIGNFLELL